MRDALPYPYTLRVAGRRAKSAQSASPRLEAEQAYALLPDGKSGYLAVPILTALTRLPAPRVDVGFPAPQEARVQFDL